MTALDPFTAASLTYADAIRSLRPHKSGEALQVMPSRLRWGRWLAAIALAACVGGATADPRIAVLTALGAGAGVLLMDGWVR